MSNKEEKVENINAKENLLEEDALTSKVDDDSSSSSDDAKSDVIEVQHKSLKTVQIVGIFLMILPVLSVLISIPLSVYFQTVSAGGGIWCSIYVFFLGILVLRFSVEKDPSLAFTFCVSGFVFAVMMLIFESIELYAAVIDRIHHLETVKVLRAILILSAVAEIVLIIVVMIIYIRHATCQCYGEVKPKKRNCQIC